MNLVIPKPEIPPDIAHNYKQVPPTSFLFCTYLFECTFGCFSESEVTTKIHSSKVVGKIRHLFSVQVKVQWTEQLVATQQQKTEQIKKETEQLKVTNIR